MAGCFESVRNKNFRQNETGSIRRMEFFTGSRSMMLTQTAIYLVTESDACFDLKLCVMLATGVALVNLWIHGLGKERLNAGKTDGERIEHQ